MISISAAKYWSVLPHNAEGDDGKMPSRQSFIKNALRDCGHLPILRFIGLPMHRSYRLANLDLSVGGNLSMDVQDMPAAVLSQKTVRWVEFYFLRTPRHHGTPEAALAQC